MVAEDALRTATQCITTLRQLIEQAQGLTSDPEIETKVRQLRELERTIRRMEASHIAVPDELRHLRMDLTAATSRVDDAMGFMAWLRAELAPLLSMLDLGVGRKPSSTGSGRGGVARAALTPHSVLRDAIIQALQDLGGSGDVQEIIGRVYDLLRDRWTPEDLATSRSGFVRWKSRIHWERLNMVKHGVLRGDSPRGIWELA